jgi:hypothetical protein
MVRFHMLLYNSDFKNTNLWMLFHKVHRRTRTSTIIQTILQVQFCLILLVYIFFTNH